MAPSHRTGRLTNHDEMHLFAIRGFPPGHLRVWCPSGDFDMDTIAGKRQADDGLSANSLSTCDAMWLGLEQWLDRDFEVDGVFYLSYPVGETGGELGMLFDRAIFHVTYPRAYMESLSDNPLANDRPAEIVLTEKTPCRWHAPATWEGASEAQRATRAKDVALGMEVGLCIPLLSEAGHVSGGFGLRHRHQDAARFDALLAARMDDLLDGLHDFDRRFRGPFARATFALSAQETRVLSHVAGGMSVLRAAHQMNLSPKTVEAYLATIRRKTRSQSTAEAVAKAIFFHLV